MENLEIIKQELISQKSAIESKGGSVVVSNLNPTPNEITEGIKSIYIPDLSVATATESDVTLGKTFFAGDVTLKTGIKEEPAENLPQIYQDLFINADETSEELYYLSIPKGIKNLKGYLCYYNETKNVEVTFNPELETIGNYTFYKCRKTTFTNFETLENLKDIGSYCFAYNDLCSISLENLPQSIETLGNRCFYCSIPEYTSLLMPDSLKSFGSYVFATEQKTEMKNLYMPDSLTMTELLANTFENLIFDCDFKIPPSITTLAINACYGCSFNNIIIPVTCTRLNNSAFNCSSSDPLSSRRLKTVTFEAETPPSISINVFSKLDIQNNFKIYVPDNSLEAYKAITNLANFVNHIYPMSEKE